MFAFGLKAWCNRKRLLFKADDDRNSHHSIIFDFVLLNESANVPIRTLVCLELACSSLMLTELSEQENDRLLYNTLEVRVGHGGLTLPVNASPPRTIIQIGGETS